MTFPRGLWSTGADTGVGTGADFWILLTVCLIHGGGAPLTKLHFLRTGGAILISRNLRGLGRRRLCGSGTEATRSLSSPCWPYLTIHALPGGCAMTATRGEGGRGVNVVGQIHGGLLNPRGIDGGHALEYNLNDVRANHNDASRRVAERVAEILEASSDARLRSPIEGM